MSLFDNSSRSSIYGRGGEMGMISSLKPDRMIIFYYFASALEKK